MILGVTLILSVVDRLETHCPEVSLTRATVTSSTVRTGLGQNGGLNPIHLKWSFVALQKTSQDLALMN